jgi:hypothetical protein
MTGEVRLFGVPLVRRYSRNPAPAGKLAEQCRVAQSSAPFEHTRLTHAKVRMILRDPMVKFCNRVIATPVTRVDVGVTGRDPAQVEYVQKTLVDSGVVEDYQKKAVTARDFGYFIAETRYKQEGGLVVLKTFKALPLERCTIIEDDGDGGLLGIEYDQPGQFGVKVTLEAKDGKFVLVTNRYWESESNRYGKSELEEVREWVYAKRFTRDQMMRWIERKANPPTGCYFRPGAVNQVTSEGQVTESNIGDMALRFSPAG